MIQAFKEISIISVATVFGWGVSQIEAVDLTLGWSIQVLKIISLAGSVATSGYVFYKNVKRDNKNTENQND